ncbi:RasGAP domain-containing protein [Rhizoctonia solani AG-1 IA]|uniref:RasGAP domain-containing protein n=1 Tax=Thanatephorus cucumeris (strain AG1-IA) TaxID=983506 RepID=L8X9P3_THACA|nr:RasGAP domain-containing protein [Rhizoctonia solani AG-1 IA]
MPRVWSMPLVPPTGRQCTPVLGGGFGLLMPTLVTVNWKNRRTRWISEISSLIVGVQDKSKLAIANAARQAVWNWIEILPNEYTELLSGQRTLDGGPERLFDVLCPSQFERDGKQRLYWPTLTVLLAASPERLQGLEIGASGGRAKRDRKIALFKDSLVKGSQSSTRQLRETAIACIGELSKAASFAVGKNASHADSVPIKSLAQDVMSEVKNRLFSPPAPHKSFTEQNEAIDVSFHVDSLVAIFRSFPTFAASTAFPAVLAPECSEAVKLAGVRACLLLASESTTEQTAEQYPDGTIVAPRLHPVAQRNAPDLTDREQLILALLALFRTDVRFFFTLRPNVPSDIPRCVRDSLLLLRPSFDPCIRTAAARTFGILAATARQMQIGHPLGVAAKELAAHTGPNALRAGALLVYNSTNTTDLRLAYNSLISIVLARYANPVEVTRSRRAQTSTDNPKLSSTTKMLNTQAALALYPVPPSKFLIMVEVACLIALTSIHQDIVTHASRNLGLLVVIEKMELAPEPGGCSADLLLKRASVYEALGDTNVVVVAHTKVIAYRSGSKYNQYGCVDGVLYEMGGAYITARTIDRSLQGMQDGLMEWQNLTMFLATWGGSCVCTENRYPAFRELIQSEEIPKRMLWPPSANKKVEEFIVRMVGLLKSTHLFCRETVKDALGQELHPRSAKDKLEREHPWSPDLCQCLEQFVTVLKLIFERIESETDTSHIKVSISALVRSLLQLLHAAPKGDSWAMRIRVKFCHMAYNLFEKRDYLALEQELLLRSQLLEAFAEWAMVELPSNTPDAQHRTQGEVNVACLKTVVLLLDRFQLGVPDRSQGTDDDVTNVRSRLFYRYFQFFLRVVKQCFEKFPVGDERSQRVAFGLAKDVPMYRQLAIRGLSLLLDANMDVGLKHCLSMAYHDDPNVRAIFIHVFSQVLGTEPTDEDNEEGEDGENQSEVPEDNGGKAEVKIDPEPEDKGNGKEKGKDKDEEQDGASVMKRRKRFQIMNHASEGQVQPSRLCEIMIAMAMCNVCPSQEIDNLIHVILNIFDSRKTLLRLLKALIDREVAQTTSDSNLFRSNSMCMRVLSAFARMHGYNYIRQILSPLISQMVNMPADRSYELDPKRPDGKNVEENAKSLSIIAQAFLHVICESAPILPPIIREVCKHIADAVSEVWPESGFPAVGSFMFLRFICPAIVSPESVDIELPRDNARIRRGLMLITKIIQNLANNVLFGKEPYLIPLNNLLERYQQPPEEEYIEEWLGTTYDEVDQMVLHRYFSDNVDKIGKDLLIASKVAHSQTSDTVAGKRQWDKLVNVLVELGQPVEVPMLSRSTAEDHLIYKPFMRSQAHRTPDASIRDMFIQAPGAKLTSLQLIGSNSAAFDLILDCTAFSATSEIPTQWINEFVEVTPFDFVERLRTIYIVNPNQLAQKFLRKMYHRFSGMGIGKTVVAVSAMAELIEKMHPDSLAPLTAANILECIPIFTPTYAFTDHNECSYVGRPIAIYPGLNCKLTDTIFLRDIDDVYNTAAGREAGEFVIRRHDGARTMFFASRDREEIVKAIRTSKNNLNMEGKFSIRDHFPHIGDISATLMNVALLNLGAENEQLRSGAYELLCSVCHYLEYKDFRLVTSRGFFFPANNSVFAAYFSDKLASHAPELTLDFLGEFAIGFNKATSAQQVASLNYLHPWVSNLIQFLDPTSKLFDPSSSKLIWENLGRSNTGTVNATLDELTRSAIDGGLGSTRCELIAEALVNMSSVEVKGKLLARLRRAITRIKNPPPASPADDIAWNEVAAITRLVYMVLQNNRPPVQILIYIPEIFYLVTVLCMVGPLLLRKTIYGILVNVVQAFLTNKHTDDETKENLRRLLNQTMDPEFQTVLGITRPDTRSEFTVVDPQSDSVAMVKLEELTSYLLEIISCGAWSTGLANTWRGRWMGLLSSTSFQLSAYVQSRAFVVLGRLLEIPNTDVDDDLFYQMLVAFQSALATANEDDPTPLLSMLRCLSKAVARLPAESRYLAQVAWIAIALIQSGCAALFSEAAALLEATLIALDNYNAFAQRTLTSCLKEYRSESLDEIYLQLDELHSLSYASEATFSFSLASIISRGLRLAPTCAPAVSLLRTLLRISRDAQGPSPGPRGTLHTDRIGYFLALLSQATTSTDYAQLLELAGLDPDWLPPADADDLEKSGAPPEIDIKLFGEMTNETVLLVSSFAVTMINCSQSEIERQILFGLISEAVMVYPEIVAIACESMLDRINDAFSNSPNSTILHAVSTIFRLTLSDRMWTNEPLPSNVTSPHSVSTSTLSTNGEASAISNIQNGSQTHDYALGELKMRGRHHGDQLPGFK